MNVPPGYEQGFRITWKLIGVAVARGQAPRWRFPPSDTMVLADLRDLGGRLALDEPTRELERLLIRRCVERTGQAPTAVMLRMALDQLGVPVEVATLADLGLAVTP